MQECQSLRVLVVEDDPDTRANLRDILELDDYQVDTATTLAEALGRDHWEDIFAVILDRRLPDGDAEGVLPRLKQLAPEVAILVVTGYPDLEGALGCLRQGAADYILKPIRPEALRASLGGIAERKRLAAARERSEAAFRHLVEAAECMIVILRPDYSLAYLSPFAEELTGHKAADAQGQNYLELFLAPVHRPAAAELFDRVLGGVSARGFQNRIRCQDGSERWVLWNARRLNDYDGQPAVLAIGQDITAHKRAEDRALQAERLAAIGEMMTGLAHESRNALQRSKASLEMLALEVENRPDLLDLVARAQKAQDYLHRLYEEVRGYAAPIRLRMRSCSLAEVWREVWEALALSREGRNIVLVEAGSGADPRVDADPFALGQVFRNIFENALAACPNPGEVRIAVADTLLDGKPAVRISIRDNGPGLNPEQRNRIFEPFFTTKTRGTGLGMAIARRIVEGHGGSIDVGRPATAGTEILITLPRRQPEDIDTADGE